MKFLLSIVLFSVTVGFALFQDNCDQQAAPTPQTTPQSSSGVKKADVQVTTNDKGHTVEQENIINRVDQDNKSGSIKHLYIVSAYSGDVIIYSTVKGKVTSSGKRLTPTSVVASEQSQYGIDGHGNDSTNRGIPVNIGGRNYFTSEVLQDDGTYGSSAEYIYWFDTAGVYHQQYITGGLLVHVSSQPINVRKIILNLETKDVPQ